MTFWGIELKKGKIVTQTFPKACLGRDPRTHLNARFLIECSVGGQPPTVICSLEKPNNCMCPLDIEFGEDDEEVHFSVYGCNFKEETVHLSGYFIDQ
ncbi:hypothetical protein MKW98_029712 [Papaver atlanticum]|uniref:Nucleoplasmin-like domain-containing protein n=1 Tax=Papaver atlanticum TaxID=357466 RepID=A0AAD4XR63_9MAGN|nr:hypothetical protein MKW98_029712 [Papaver atlanticum]